MALQRRAFLGLGAAGITSLAGCTIAPSNLSTDEWEDISAEDIRVITEADVSVDIRAVEYMNDILFGPHIECTVDIHANETSEYNIRLVFIDSERVSIHKDEVTSYLLHGETARFTFNSHVPDDAETVAIAVGRMDTGDQAPETTTGP